MSSNLKKSAHVFDTDDLIAILEQKEAESKDEQPTLIEDDVLNFIGTFGLEPGTEKIKQHTLYLIYKVWSKAPLKKGDFLSKVFPYFETCQVGNSAAFFINQGAIKLTHSAYKYYSNTNIRLTSKHWVKHFQTFLTFHSLSKGDYWIDVRILYFIYDKYCNATGLDKNVSTYLGKETFRHYAKLYLPVKLTKHGEMVAVSDNIKQFFQIGQLDRMIKDHEKETQPKKRRSTRKPKSKAKPKN